MKVLVGADHLGIDLKEFIIKYLKENNFLVEELIIKNKEYDDYPDFAFELGEKVVKENVIGILVCGNGIGMSIAANKVKGIRAARVLNVDDVCKAKNHNGANVIALSANLDHLLCEEMIDAFIATKYPTEERYLRRIEKIKEYEQKC